MKKFSASLILLTLLLSSSFVSADVIIDSINYSIKIDDFNGQPNTIVKLPVKLKNAMSIGAFYIRIEYDTLLLSPVTIGAPEQNLYYVSLELVDRGWNSIHIDSGGGIPPWDTTYCIWANNIIGSNAINILFMPPPLSSSRIPVNLGEPTTILNLLFKVNCDSPFNQSTSIFVKNDTANQYQYIQLADTAGAYTILPGNGPVYAESQFMAETTECGDANADNSINILDIVALISYLFMGGQPPCPVEVGDINSSGEVNLFDITHMISHLYEGGPPPNCLY